MTAVIITYHYSVANLTVYGDNLLLCPAVLATGDDTGGRGSRPPLGGAGRCADPPAQQIQPITITPTFNCYSRQHRVTAGPAATPHIQPANPTQSANQPTRPNPANPT